MNDEYRQLVELLTGQFGEVETGFAQVNARFAEIDARFAEVNARFAQIDQQFVIVHREFANVRTEIRQASDSVDEKLGDFRREVRAGFDEVKSLIRIGHIDLDRRVRRLEEGG